jgi:hypothetical protein
MSQADDATTVPPDSPRSDVDWVRDLVRSAALRKEAGSSERLVFVIYGVSALLLVGVLLRQESPAPRVSAAMLQALLFQVACVTAQVSGGRLQQVRRTREVKGQAARPVKADPASATEPAEAAQRDARRRAVGWAIALLPSPVALGFLLACGFRWDGPHFGTWLDSTSTLWTWVALVTLIVATVLAGETARVWVRQTKAYCSGLHDEATQQADGDAGDAAADQVDAKPPAGADQELGSAPALALSRHRRSASGDAGGTGSGPGQAASDQSLALAFSGGGIRSASFCLGGFSTLQSVPKRLAPLDAIVAVSGGSYAAAALSIARTFDSSGDRYPATALPITEVYAVDSAELAYLRRNSRYLFQPAWRTASGLWQLVAGAFLHVVLALAGLRFCAWLLGWYINIAGIVTGLDTDTPRFQGDHHLWRVVLSFGPWVLAVGVLAWLLGQQAVRRGEQGSRPREEGKDWSTYLPSAPSWARRVSLSGRLLFGTVLALVVVPLLFIGLGRAAYDSSTPSVLSKAIVGIGLTTDSGCRDALVHSAQRAYQQVDAAEGIVATDRTASYGACGYSSTVSLPDEPQCGQCATGVQSLPPFDEDQVVAAAGASFGTNASVTGRSSGRFFAVLAAIGAALSLVGRAFAALPKSSGQRFARVRRALLLRLPLATVALVGFLLALVWTFHYCVGAAPQSQLWPFLLIWLAVGGQLVNPNTTSMHEFYRERLASAFAVGRSRDDSGAGALPADRTYRLTDLALPPELVVCGTANVNDPLFVPTRRFGVPLSFSPRFVRLEAAPVAEVEVRSPDNNVGYRDTASLQAEPRWRALTIMSAVAMSGAAVSPLMGRVGGKVAPFRLLLTLFNIRLGVWVPNPRWPSGEAAAPWWAPMSTNPRFHQLFREAFGSTLVDDRWLYVTDGGHLDNLGMVEAVRRLPARLLVLSASNDPAGTWQDVGAAVSVIRADLGIDLVEVDRDYQDSWLRLSGSWRETDDSTDHPIDILVVRATLVDPTVARQRSIAPIVDSSTPPATGKAPSTPTAAAPPVDSTLPPATAREHDQAVDDVENPMPVDVWSFHTRDAAFPRASTGRQDFGDLEFESYRRLGQFLVERAIRQTKDFEPPPPSP